MNDYFGFAALVLPLAAIVGAFGGGFAVVDVDFCGTGRIAGAFVLAGGAFVLAGGDAGFVAGGLLVPVAPLMVRAGCFFW